jgi:hypothetical protein
MSATQEVNQMSETTSAAAAAQEIAFPKRALMALGEVPDLRCGALSPLARISPPEQPSDRAALLDALTALQGQWTWAAPALLDPHLTVAMLFGDGDTSLIGQYLWPDPEARGPGFRAVVEKDAVRLSGPLSDDEVLLSCLDLVLLDGVAEAEPLKMTFSLEQFWATLALLDAYRISLLRRRLSRQGGYPAGVSGAGLAEAWKAGIAVTDPGWSVSLFALLRPDLVPGGFEARVAGVVDAMDGAGLLAKLAGDPGDPLGDVYILGRGLDLLCQAVLTGIVHIGVSVQRLRAADEIEFTSVAGWRTGGGFWLADLSSIPLGGRGDVVVSLLGPGSLTRLIEYALGGNAQVTDAPFEMATPYSRDALVGALRPAVPATTESETTAPATKSTRAAKTTMAAATTELATATELATTQEPATATPTPAWSPTHTVPAEGMTAWAAPDPTAQSVALAGGLPVAVVERAGDWAHVTASNGWSGWVDGRRLN